MAGRGLATDLAGLAVLVGAGYGVYNEYQKSQQAALPASQRATTTISNTGMGPVVVRENAREFISKLAEKGDDTAVSTVKTVQKHPSIPKLVTPSIPAISAEDEPFRFDVSREGLIGTLSALLESKRTYEASFLAECRRTGRYPQDFAVRCKEMREEKEALKRILDELENKKKSWWFW